MYLEVSEKAPASIKPEKKEEDPKSDKKSSKKEEEPLVEKKDNEEDKKEEKKEAEEGDKKDDAETPTFDATAVPLVKKKELIVEPKELRFSANGGMQKLNVINNTDTRLVVKVPFNNN